MNISRTEQRVLHALAQGGAIRHRREQGARSIVQVDCLTREGFRLAACDLTLIASGTATLEAALFKRPMVITYVMHALNWQMMKRMSYQPWVGLPNILLRDFAVPEFLQAAATPEKIAEAGFAWLDDPARCAALHARFDALHRELRCDTAQRATDAIEAVLAR